jgi:hypothetical protein
MKTMKIFNAALIIILTSSFLSAQDQKPANVDAAPPNIALLVQQDVFPGKAVDREKLEIDFSRAFDHLEIPRFWIDLEPLTGTQEALVFSLFDSYEQLGQSNADWSQFLATRPDLAHEREQIDGLIGSQRKIVAVRRDDLGYLAESIDLSEARFVNVLEVRLFPGREDDFADAFKILADAYGKIHADGPWVVYQVDVGTPAPTFLVLRPMSEIKQNDDLLSWNAKLAEAEGDQSVETLKKITRESFASTESNLYAVKPEMSHVSKSFAATDPDFWFHRATPEMKPEPKPESKPDVKPTVSRPKK